MNLPDIKTLYDYDSWAVDRIMAVIDTIPENEYMKDLKSSHG